MDEEEEEDDAEELEEELEEVAVTSGWEPTSGVWSSW